MRIMFVGDINLGEYYTSFGHGPRTYLEHSDVFAEVRELFSEADLVVGNLEAPLTTSNFNKDEPESVVLRGHPRHAKLLWDAGFRVLQVANNHTVQHGKQGFDETVEVLKGAGIKVVGLNLQEPVTIELAGERVGFLAASDVPDNTDQGQQCYQRLNLAFLEKVKASVAKVDHLFVLLHWGLESSTTPMEYQLKLMETLSDAGVRGIIGSHPHLFYEVRQDDSSVYAPSLGNFVFDLCWDQRLLQSGVLDVQIDDGKLTTKLHPIKIEAGGCLPTIQGAPIDVTSAIHLYELGDDMSGELARKLRYFVSNIFKGNLKLKAIFFIRKLLPFARSSAVDISHG